MTETIFPRKPKILCVDDDNTTLLIYKKYLGNMDCEMMSATDAQAGFALAVSEEPDLIISDVVMPGDSGLDFCRKIRTEPSLSATIFLLASGQKTRPADTLDGVDVGADDYLIKPFEQDEFLAKIKAFLRIKALQDDLVSANRKLNSTLDSLNDAKRQLEEKNAVLTEDKQFLEHSLKQLSLMAAEREKTNEALEQLNKRHQGDIESLIKILSELIESKRQYHRGHSKKVAEISTFIARSLGLSEAEIRDIEISARLHELGKLSIAEELAMKNPEDYTQKEKDFLIQHPVKAAGILEKFSSFERVANIIRHFHERFDGTGFPDGLTGDEIPLGSRILAAANLFDNLVFRRKGMDVQRTLEMIDEEMGAVFDPAMGHHLHKYVHAHPPDETLRTRELRLYELEPGMELASSLYTVSGAKLLPINTVLTEAAIGRLASYHKSDPIEETVFVKA
jgi:response regulator RpfG family c-di-GMP phosphodiesterase